MLTTFITFIGLPLVSIGSNIAASVDNSEKTTNKLILATALYASSVYREIIQYIIAYKAVHLIVNRVGCDEIRSEIKGGSQEIAVMIMEKMYNNLLLPSPQGFSPKFT